MHGRRSQRRPRFLAALVLGVALGAGRREGAQAAEPGPSEAPPLTAFEAGPWRRSALVLLGRVSDYRSLNRDLPEGPGSARVEVERVFRGTPPGSAFTLLVAGPRPTLDPTDPSAPYFAPGSAGRYVLFLSRRPEGAAYVLEGLVDATGLAGEERVRSLEAEVALLGIADPEERARRTLAHFLQALRGEGTWTRVHAARELNAVALARPDLFDAAARRRIAAVAETPGPAQQKALLQRLLARLAKVPLPPAGSEAVPSPPLPGADAVLVERLRGALAEAGPDQAARRDVLVRFAGASGARGAPVLWAVYRVEGPDVRLWVVSLLAESGARAFLPAVRAAYANEEDAEVRGSIVRAVGLLGDDADLPWLEERLANERLKTEVLFALARIRSAEAMALLAREGDRAAASDAPEDAQVVERVRWLRSAEFEAAERAAGRRVGPLPDTPR